MLETRESNRERWLSLWQRMGMLGNGEEEFVHLERMYFEPHRAYHVMDHISHCLDELIAASHFAPHPDIIAFALWYHDAFYDTHAKDNEEKSAELAARILRRTLAPPIFVERVPAMILATKHTTSFDDLDTQLLIDIDLSILGQPEPVFNEYERNIRKEYEWIPFDTFAEGRSRILQLFLERPQIYKTLLFSSRYEVQARKNILRSLLELSSV